MKSPGFWARGDGFRGSGEDSERGEPRERERERERRKNTHGLAGGTLRRFFKGVVNTAATHRERSRMYLFLLEP